MDINLLSKSYIVRRLGRSDIDRIYNLSCKNEIFYQYHPPFVTKKSILEDMEALPPKKSLEDKYYIGFFQNDFLVAIMDLILDYPTKEIAYIGLFMMHTKYQGKGIGSMIITQTADYLKVLNYKKIRIGVDKGNPQSYAFWIKNKFDVIREDEYKIMELEL